MGSFLNKAFLSLVFIINHFDESVVQWNLGIWCFMLPVGCTDEVFSPFSLFPSLPCEKLLLQAASRSTGISSICFLAQSNLSSSSPPLLQFDKLCQERDLRRQRAEHIEPGDLRMGICKCSSCLSLCSVLCACEIHSGLNTTHA